MGEGSDFSSGREGRLLCCFETRPGWDQGTAKSIRLTKPKKAPMDERNKSCYFVFFSYLSLRGTLRYSYYNFPTYDYSLLDTLCRICCLSKVGTAAASSGPKFGSISGEQSAVKRLDPKIRPTFCLRLLRSGNVHIRRRDNGMVFHVFSKRDRVR